MTDDVPANTTFGGFVSIPAGATSAFAAAPAGGNNNGLITVSGITVPANALGRGGVRCHRDAGTAPGRTIDNTAVVDNPNGPEKQLPRHRRWW